MAGLVGQVERRRGIARALAGRSSPEHKPVTVPWSQGRNRPALPTRVGNDRLMTAAREPSYLGRQAAAAWSGPPSDLVLGAFSETPPWDLTGKDLPWRADVMELRCGHGRARSPSCCAAAVPPGLAGARHRRQARLGDPCAGAWSKSAGPTDWAGREMSRAGLSRRLRKAFERLGPTYIKLGQILSSGEGVFPPELVGEFRLLRDQVPPESVSRRPKRRRSRPGPATGRGLRAVRDGAHRRGLDRPGPCRPLAHGRGRRREGATPPGRRPGRARHRRHELAGPSPDRPHPGGYAGQPAGAGRAVRRDDRRGARLPPRGRQHARHRRACWPDEPSAPWSYPGPTPSW